MPKYICAGKLINRIEKYQEMLEADEQRICDTILDIVTEYIVDEKPTDEVVKIVRCKDCEYRDKNYGIHNFGSPFTNYIWCEKYNDFKKEDGFCSEGETE